MNDPETHIGHDEENDLPVFRQLKKSYAPPEGYFDQLPDQVMNRWSQRLPETTPAPLMIRRMWAAAAVLTGLCIGIALWTSQTRFTPGSQPISSNEAMQYILEHVEDFEPLLMQSALLNNQEAIDKEEPDATEEYLLEELQEEDLETIY